MTYSHLPQPLAQLSLGLCEVANPFLPLHSGPPIWRTCPRCQLCWKLFIPGPDLLYDLKLPLGGGGDRAHNSLGLPSLVHLPTSAGGGSCWRLGQSWVQLFALQHQQLSLSPRCPRAQLHTCSPPSIPGAGPAENKRTPSHQGHSKYKLARVRNYLQFQPPTGGFGIYARRIQGDYCASMGLVGGEGKKGCREDNPILKREKNWRIRGFESALSQRTFCSDLCSSVGWPPHVVVKHFKFG